MRRQHASLDGVTKERLDRVSDSYRDRPQGGELWRHRPARAHALVEGGRITRVVVTDAGAGSSSPPRVTIRGFEQVKLAVTLRFDKDLAKNGSIQSIAVQK